MLGQPLHARKCWPDLQLQTAFKLMHERICRLTSCAEGPSERSGWCTIMSLAGPTTRPEPAVSPLTTSLPAADEVRLFTVLHPSPESELRSGVGTTAGGARTAPIGIKVRSRGGPAGVAVLVRILAVARVRCSVGSCWLLKLLRRNLVPAV